MNRRRVGLLGGTFDPVHSGHVQMAEAALAEFHLDTVAFVPAGKPPHKTSAAISAFEHRVSMLELVCAGTTNLNCNAIEGGLATPSYTVDTLIELLEYYGPTTELFFLIGVDAFIDILTWKAHQDILKMISLIVFKRQGLLQPGLVSFLSGLGYSEQSHSWHGKNGQKNIYVTDYIPDNVSSSVIREKIRNGQVCVDLISENVFNYIKMNRLYC